MDATDADGEWSDEELLRSGSQTGVSDDQDTGLSSGQDKRRSHRQKTDTSAGSESEIPRARHKNHHHRPSLGSLIKKMSASHEQHVEEQHNSWDAKTNNGTNIVCMPVVTSFPPTSDASAALNLNYSSVLGTFPAESTKSMTSSPDPVSAILDKIDAQIDAMDAKDMSVVPKLTSGVVKSARLSKSSSSRSKSGQSGLNGSGDTGLGSLHDSEISDPDRSKVNIAGSTEMLSEMNLTDGFTDDERARRLDSDIPSDLDSVAAQQIDIKFKEIMRKKKDSPDEAAEEMAKFVRQILSRKSTGSCDLVTSSQLLPSSSTKLSAEDLEGSRSRPVKRQNRMPPDLPLPPSSGKKTGGSSSRGAAAAASQLGSKLRSRSATRPSATMLSTGYGTDNDSVRTEEFETKFMSLLVGGGQGGVSDSDGGRSKPETPRRRPNSVPADVSKVSPSASQLQPQLQHQVQPQPQSQLPVPGLAKEDEELLQKLVRSANETRRSASPTHSTLDHAPASSPAPIISRPRSVSPTRLSLQRYRTAENLRLNWENPGGSGSQRRQNHLFSWDDDFWKQTSRKSPQSVASSASTFEEVESLCFSRSSSDSHNSSLRNWDNRYIPSVGWAGTGNGRQMWAVGRGGGGAGYPGGRVGSTAGSSSSRRQRISRQSSTTSTSTSRSSAGVGAAGGEDEASDYQRRASQDSHGRLSDAQSITGKLIESMEFLGSSGNLDLADRLYLEKIFHRVIGEKQSRKYHDQPPPQPQPLKSALKKHPRNYAQPEMLSGNEALLKRLQRLRRKQLIQRESGSAPASATSSPVLTAKKDNVEKKRRKDLIIPDDEEPPTPRKPQWTPQADGYSTLRREINDVRQSGPNNKNLSGDSYSKSSMISSMSSLSMENGSLRASPVGSTAPASPNNLSEQQPNLNTFLSVNSPVQRFSSFDSTATCSASDGAMNVFSQPFSPSHAERVLMGLGFGAAEGFLPERFLKDWYNKISRAHSDSSSGGGRSINETIGASNAETNHSMGRGLYHSKSVGQFESSSNQRYQASTENEKSSFRGPHVLQRHDSHLSSISSILDEAASYLPKGGDPGSRNERIGDYIVAHSPPSNQIPQGGSLNSRGHKMRQFANARQKSLPLHLETLTEEDELRIRKSGFHPFDKEARLQMFISDTMSTSGRSTNSEQSRCGSNPSESDSLSSCFEMIDSQVTTETPHWQQTTAYRKQQDQIPRQLQQSGKQPKRKNRHHDEQKETEPSKKEEKYSRKQTRKQSDPQSDKEPGDERLSQKQNDVESHSQPETIQRDRSPKGTNTKLASVQGKVKTSPKSNNTGGNPNCNNFGNKGGNAAFQQRETGTSPSHQMHSISITSGDSLEVADIMQFGLGRSSRFMENFEHKYSAREDRSDLQNQRNPPLKSIEPAMVSIVLEDVDQDADGNKQGHELAIGPQEGNHLHIPLSRCSSSSLSPIPQSPVTVIEVGQLDNQQDSLDTEGTASSKDTDDEACSENSGKSRCGSKARHSRQVKSLRLSPPSLKLLEQRRGSDNLVPQLNINDKPLETRRFSLDVPTVARLRRISEERLQELNSQVQVHDIEEERLSPSDLSIRRGSPRRASFSEEKPVIINDFLARKSSSRSPSPSSRKSCLVQSSESSLEHSSRKRNKSKERRISRNASPSKSPTSSLFFSKISSKDRESPAGRHNKNRHGRSHHYHHISLEDEKTVSASYNDGDDKRPQAKNGHVSSEGKDHGNLQKHHCCCCRHHDHQHPNFLDQDKDDHRQDNAPNMERTLGERYKDQEGEPLDKINLPVQNSTHKRTDAVTNVQVQLSPQDASIEGLTTFSNTFSSADPNEKQSPLQNPRAFFIPRSLESSPGSARSAFTFTRRSGSKGNLSLPGGSGNQSETDVEEFPSTVKLTLNQRPISSFTKNIIPEANPFRRNSSSSSLVSIKGNGFSPSLLFSSCPKKEFGNTDGDDGKGRSAIHMISRAVQVTGNQLDGSTTEDLTLSSTHSQMFYFLAKDQATQCSTDVMGVMGQRQLACEHYGANCSHTYQSNRGREEHVQIFNKSTQTTVTRYEVSSQTEWVRPLNSTPFQDTGSRAKADSHYPTNINSKDQPISIDSETKRFSSIKDTSNSHDIQNSPEANRYNSTFTSEIGNFSKFCSIDETLELIEAELLQIDNKQKQKFERNIKHVENSQSSGNGFQISPKDMQPRAKDLTLDKRVPERYAPSSWSDATRLSPNLTLQYDNNVTWTHADGSKKRRMDFLESIASSSKSNIAVTDTNMCVSPLNVASKRTEAENSFMNKPSSSYPADPNLYTNDSDSKPTSNSQHLRPPLSNLQNIPRSTIATTFNTLSSTVCDTNSNQQIRDCIRMSPAFQSTENTLRQMQTPRTGENGAGLSRSNHASPPTVDSKDLIVKMYELQRGLTSYLKPCEGMYSDEDVRILQDDNYSSDIKQVSDNSLRGKENTEPFKTRLIYDFSIENANTSSGFSNLFYGSNKAKRRFSTPAVCDGTHWSRTHSKLSRLKYQNNSHQNSLNSLDIEVDFMNAGDISGLSKIQKLSHIPSTDQNNKRSESNIINEEDSNYPEKVAFGEKGIIDNENKIEARKSCQPTGNHKAIDQKSSAVDKNNGQINTSSAERDSILAKSRSSIVKNLQLLSPCPSNCSSNKLSSEGRNTPEIVISPLMSVHTTFLTVPSSAQHLLLKARFPSVSSTPSGGLSPSRSDSSKTKTKEQINSVPAIGIVTESTSKPPRYAENKVPNRKSVLGDKVRDFSVTSSIQGSSTLGSVTDLSMSSQDIQSTSDFSKTSMYPHLSLDSVGELNGTQTLQSALDDFCDQDIGVLEPHDYMVGKDNLKLRRDMSLLGIQADASYEEEIECKDECYTCGEGNYAESDSNASLAGSDLCKDVDDMEVMLHQSRVMRQNSSSTYSEPDLDLIDTFSDDSLPSSLNEELAGNVPGAFLTVSRISNVNDDDLLQVSDYGGYSPIPSPRISTNRESSPDSITSASACKPEGQWQELSNPQNKKQGVSLQRRVLQKAFSESWANADYSNTSVDEENTRSVVYGIAENEEHSDASEDFAQRLRREGSKDNWDVVRAIIECQHENPAEQLVCEHHVNSVTKPSENKLRSSTFDISESGDDRPHQSDIVASNYNEDSSGDECDKEITRITDNSFSSENWSPRSHNVEQCSTVEYIDAKDIEEKLIETNNLVRSYGKTEEHSSPKISFDKTAVEDETSFYVCEENGAISQNSTEQSKVISILTKQKSFDDGHEDVTGSPLNIKGGDIEMLEVFQNADLSVLKIAGGMELRKTPEKPIRSPKRSHDFSVDDLSIPNQVCGVEQKKGENKFIPRVVSLEFSSDEEIKEPFLLLSDGEFSSALPSDDLDSGLTEDLELVLSKSGDEFDELTNSLLVKDANSPISSGLLHTPLSQITEEDTQSDCSIGEASIGQKQKVWNVRNRFIYPDANPSKGTIVKLPRSIFEKTYIAVGQSTISIETKEALPKLDDSPEYAKLSSSSEISENEHKTQSNKPQDDHMGAKNQLSTIVQGIKNHDDEITKSFHFIDPDSNETKYKHQDKQCISGITDNISAHANKEPEIVSNLVLTRSTLDTNDATHHLSTRVLSPNSGVFKFAQALLEDALGEAQAEHAEERVTLRQDFPISTKTKPNSPSQIFNSETVERTLDKVGNVTTKVSESTVTKKFNLNAPSEIHSHTEKNAPEEKHVSTKTLQIGDYRETKSKVKAELVDDVFNDNSTLHSMKTEEHITNPVNKDSSNDLSARNPVNVDYKIKENSFMGKKVDGECEDEIDPIETNSYPRRSKEESSWQCIDEINRISDSQSKSYGVEKPGANSVDVPQREEINVVITETTGDNYGTDSNQILTEDAPSLKVQKDSHQEYPEFSVDDLKSRVKAMLLIDYGKAPGSSDSSIKDESPGGFKPASSIKNLLPKSGSESSNASTPALKRVKVTTMFSQTSEDGGVAFMSSSIGDSGSDVDKSPVSDFDDRITGKTVPAHDNKMDAHSPQRSIRTQLPQSKDMAFRTQQSRGGGGRGRKQLKSFKSRDSLLKLHQQTHVSSSAGSDSDSDLQSVLRNQKQLRGKSKEPDTSAQRQQNLATEKVNVSGYDHDSQEESKDKNPSPLNKTQFLSVEPERRRPRRKLCSPEPNRHRASHEDSSSVNLTSIAQEKIARNVRWLSSSSESSICKSTSNPSTPKVIVQQPSEDAAVPSSQMGNFFVFPTRFSNLKGSNKETADSNDNHLHSNPQSPAIAGEPLSSGMNKGLTSPGPIRPRGPWGLRAHRPRRPQFLSPNAATRPPIPVTFAPTPDVTNARQEDPTHPELAYLDIVSRMKSVSREEKDQTKFSGTTNDKKAHGKPISQRISPPSITKTDFTDSDINLKPASVSPPSLDLRNLGSPEPRVVNEIDNLDNDDTVEHLDLFQTGPNLDTEFNAHAVRPALSVIISCDQSELDNMQQSHTSCEDDLEVTWPSKSLSVASRDSGFESQSQGSPSDMMQAQKLGAATPVRSIDIVKEESEI